MPQLNKDAPHGLHDRATHAALDLLREMRTDIPAMRQVAEAVNEPVERLNSLFPSDEALLIASIEKTLVRLIDICTRAVVQVDPADPIGQFQALGDAFLEWAERHPMEFALASDSEVINPREIPALRRYVDSVAAVMVRQLHRAQAQGHLHPREDIAVLAMSVRCFIVGTARMMVSGGLRDLAPDRTPLESAKALTHDYVRRMARSSQPPAASSSGSVPPEPGGRATQ